jgi:membrane protease YdiL (CAAX protease family)
MSKPTKYIARFFKSSAALILFALYFLYLAINTNVYYTTYFGVFDANQAPSLVFFILFSALILFILPAIVSKVILKDKLRSLGLALPKGKMKTVLLIIGALIILAPSIYLLTEQSQFKHYYTLKHATIQQVITMSLLFPCYYISEEFFFRGFLFLGLWKRIGWHSFWITEIIFAVSHLNKPGMEILLCIPASVVFNCITLYTRSIFPAFIVHTTLGILILVLVNYSHLFIA